MFRHNRDQKNSKREAGKGLDETLIMRSTMESTLGSRIR